MDEKGLIKVIPREFNHLGIHRFHLHAEMPMDKGGGHIYPPCCTYIPTVLHLYVHRAGHIDAANRVLKSCLFIPGYALSV